MFNLNDVPHSRLNILTGEQVLVSPHRTKRPWQGKIEETEIVNRPDYEADCYLCPGNKRADGNLNPLYRSSYTFNNDYAALLKDTPEAVSDEEGLLVSCGQRGICKVISFSPRHDLTLAEMDESGILQVVTTWVNEFRLLQQESWIKYIQIFENKGEIMGCSNPHPHGQIWSQSSLPVEIIKESEQQKKYYATHGQTLLTAYAALEMRKKERVIFENEHFLVLVPYWAIWPYETMIISKRPLQNILEFTVDEQVSLANALKRLTTRYDNLFKTSFPYSAGMHQAPVNSGSFPEWHWHMHFFPPLLRSATVKKFMVGYELLASPQRDITPEYAAMVLRGQSEQHYKGCPENLETV